MAKMGHKMLALCTAAIGIIYTTGYFVTEPPGAQVAQNIPAMVSMQSSQNSSDASTQGTPTSGTQDSSNASSQTTQGKYRDGTFYGQGSNRIGGVEVAVTIKQGKIVSCDITQSTTHYPQSYIDPVLPDQVVQRQSTQIDGVTGATKSTQDFITAVQQALAQAQP